MECIKNKHILLNWGRYVFCDLYIVHTPGASHLQSWIFLWITNRAPNLTLRCSTAAFFPARKMSSFSCCFKPGFYLIRYFILSPRSELMISEMLPKPFWNSKNIMSVFPWSLWKLYPRKIQSLISVWPTPYKTKLAISNKLKLLKLFPY